MSDLVKRLRVWAEYGFPNGTENAALDEAADRIERLEAFVAKVREASTEADASDYADRVDAALAELAGGG